MKKLFFLVCTIILTNQTFCTKKIIDLSVLPLTPDLTVTGDSTHFCMADALGLLEEAYDTLYPRNVYVGNDVSLKMQSFNPSETAIENTDCGLLISPNPAHTYVEIQITTESPEETELKICDINGKTIQVIKNLTKTLNISLKEKSPGVYYLILLNKSSVICYKKLVIE